MVKNKKIFFENKKKIHKELEEIDLFFHEIIFYTLKKLNITIVLSSAAYYIQDAIFFSCFKKNKIKLIILQRENYGPQKYQTEKIKQYFANFEPTPANLILTQNQITTDFMGKLLFYKKSKVFNVGTLRMDNFVKKIKNKKIKISKRKTVIFFSFTKNVGINIQDQNVLLSANQKKGFVNLFRNSHNMVIKYAKKNPGIDLIIKHKFGGHYLEEIEENWYKCSGESLPRNCTLTSSKNPHDLILKSNLVIAFNSTLIFESGLKNIPIVIPCFDEAAEKYRKYFDFTELKKTCLVVNKSNFIKTIHKALNHYNLNKTAKKERMVMFEKYVSSTTERSAIKISREINKII